MATPRKSSLPPPQIQLTDPNQQINRYWLDWFDNADRIIVRIEREGSSVSDDTDLSGMDRIVGVDASAKSITLTLPDPTGQNFDFIISRLDVVWGHRVTLTVDGTVEIHDETEQYIWPGDTAHIQAMNDEYRFC